MSVYIRLNPTLSGQVRGLCGNDNGDATGDLRSSNNVMETNTDNFANSWKTDGNCQDRSDLGLDEEASIRYTWAEKSCSKIKDKNIFGECHEKIDPTSFYDDCKADSVFCDRGGDCECLCTAVARYARMCCNEHNICPSWRDEDFCRQSHLSFTFSKSVDFSECVFVLAYSCGTCIDEDIWIHYENVTYPMEHTCRQYRECGPACPLTCQNYAAQEQQQCADERCYEGCFCKAGYIWDREKSKYFVMLMIAKFQ